MNELLQELQQRRSGNSSSEGSLLNKQQVNRLVGAAVSFVKKELPCVDLDSIRRTIPEVDRLVSDAEAENAALRAKRSGGGAQHRDDSDAATVTSSSSTTATATQRDVPFMASSTNTTRERRNRNGKKLVRALVAAGTVAAVAAAGLANEVRRDSASLPVQNVGQLMDLLRDVGIEPLHMLTALSVVAGFFQRELGLDMPGLLRLGPNNQNVGITSDMRRASTRKGVSTANKKKNTKSEASKKQQTEPHTSAKKNKKFALFGKRRSKDNQVE